MLPILKPTGTLHRRIRGFSKDKVLKYSNFLGLYEKSNFSAIRLYIMDEIGHIGPFIVYYIGHIGYIGHRGKRHCVCPSPYCR